MIRLAIRNSTIRGYADNRNFFKVEQWTADQHVERLLFAGNRLDKARAIFDAAVKRRTSGRYTLRQRIRVLTKWPCE